MAGARDAVRAVEARAGEKETEAARREAVVRVRERRARLAVLVALGVALVLSVTAVVVSVTASGTRSADVARQVAPDVATQVGERVVGEARTARITTGRRALGEANTRLIGRGLPIVPDPGPAASGDDLLVQAARANVIADLPEPIVAALRTELGEATTIPSSLGSPFAAGDSVVTLLPITPRPGAQPDGRVRGEPGRPVLPPAPASPGRGSSDRPGRAPGVSPPRGSTGTGPTARPPTRPAPGPPPAPAPTPAQRRGLFPLLPDLPIVPRLPLLGG